MAGAYLNLTGAMLIAGSAVVVSKRLVGSLPVFLATELSIAIGLLCLMPITFLVLREPLIKDRRTNGILFLQALCGVFLYRVLTFWGLHYTSAANSGLITSSTPVFVMILAVILLREKLTGLRIFGALLVSAGLLGIHLIPFGQSGGARAESLSGSLLILAAVFCEAVFSVLSKIRCRPMSALYRTTVITGYAFFLLLPFAICDAIRFGRSTLNTASVICVIYNGVFVSFLSYIFWFRGVRKVEAGNAAVFTGIVPVSSIILSALLLKETVTAIHMAGLLCIGAGILISCRPAGNEKINQSA